ncbi:MAG: hypothetical protein HY451_00740 [Parcubacteria group bacterium]|nr:hypothetical protein [Parcubacteria group bacterium]
MANYGIAVPNSIQSGEHSTDGGIGGLPYITDSDGNLNVFNVEHDDNGQWLNTNWFNPQNTWNDDNRFVFVRSRNYLNFSPLNAESFFNCLSQPPICLPIFSKWLERLMYFLLLMVSVSQANCRRNFMESSFTDAFSTSNSFLRPVEKLAVKRDSAIWTIKVSMRNPSVCLELEGK